MENKVINNYYEEEWNVETSEELMKEAEDLSLIDEKSICYIKNLNIKLYRPILYIFNENKFIKMTSDNEYIKVEVFNKTDIKKIECKISKEKLYKLTIEYNDCVEHLYAFNDTSEDNAKGYNKIIRKILCWMRN